MQVVAPSFFGILIGYILAAVYGTILTFALVPRVVSPFPVEDGSRLTQFVNI